MKKIIFALFIIGGFLGFTSCTEEEINSFIGSDTTSHDNVAGLKEALKVGTDTAVSRLNIDGGYFKNEAIKILLPSDLQNAITKLRSKSYNLGITSVSGESLYNLLLKNKEADLILGMNTAAEQAAAKAKPVFVNAITGMTISDATNILFGADTAATSYLKQNTYDGLFTSYDPIVDSALNSVKVGGKSVAATYEDLVASYNKIVADYGSLLGLTAIQTSDLSSYATGKALNGLFKKVSEEETAIRKDPLARVNDLLQDVFGQLDNQQ